MRITVKIGVLFALLFMLAKMMFFWSGISGDDLRPIIMINILFILLAIALGLYFHKREETEQSNMLNDIKNAMSAGVPYALLVSIFLYVYYSKIDPGYNEHKIAEQEMAVRKMLDDPQEFKTIKENEEFEILTKEEIFDRMSENARAVYSAGTTTTVSLLAMILLSTLYSILVAIVMKRFIFRY